MNISIETPAILFPALSLILLAYTNRFLAIAGLIRKLHNQYIERKDPHLLSQIKNLRRRLYLIRDMQTLGVSAIFLCMLSIFFIYKEHQSWAGFTFGASLVLFMLSLGLSVYEIFISTKALSIQLRDIEEDDNLHGFNRLTKMFREREHQ